MHLEPEDGQLNQSYVSLRVSQGIDTTGRRGCAELAHVEVCWSCLSNKVEMITFKASRSAVIYRLMLRPHTRLVHYVLKFLFNRVAAVQYFGIHSIIEAYCSVMSLWLLDDLCV